MVDILLTRAEDELIDENPDFGARPQRLRNAQVFARAVEIAQRGQLVGDLVIGELAAKIEADGLYTELGYATFEEWLDAQNSASEVADQAVISSVIVPVATSPLDSGGLQLTYHELFKEIGTAKLRMLVPSVRIILESEDSDARRKQRIAALVNQASSCTARELSMALTKPRRTLPAPDVQEDRGVVTVLWTMPVKDWLWLYKKVERNISDDAA